MIPWQFFVTVLALLAVSVVTATEKAQQADLTAAVDLQTQRQQESENREAAALASARQSQDRLDDLSRTVHVEMAHVRRAYRRHIARAIGHRNRFLRRTKHFWYDALLGLPRYDNFMTVPSNESPEEVLALANQAAARGAENHDGYEEPGAEESRRWVSEDAAAAAASASATATDSIVSSDVDDDYDVDDGISHPPSADDHYILRQFLEDVRCFLVDSHSGVDRDGLNQVVVDAAAKDDEETNGGMPVDMASFFDVPQPGDGRGAAASIGSRRSLNGEARPSTGEDMYRLVLTFKRNPYFADRFLYKQVPASHAHMLSTSDDDISEMEGRSVGLGHGNTILWSSRRTRADHYRLHDKTLLALFDDDYYQASDRMLGSRCSYVPPRSSAPCARTLTPTRFPSGSHASQNGPRSSSG
jgi:hypothetical protein